MLKIKKSICLIGLYLFSGILLPVMIQAEELNAWGGSSGRFDASKAAEQRAAEARKREKKQKAAEEPKAAEAKKTEAVQDESTSGSGNSE